MPIQGARYPQAINRTTEHGQRQFDQLHHRDGGRIPRVRLSPTRRHGRSLKDLSSFESAKVFGLDQNGTKVIDLSVHTYIGLYELQMKQQLKVEPAVQSSL